MTTRHQMTASEARENVAAMLKETPANARKRLLQLALSPLGNLSDEARAVYQAALAASPNT
jgi:hypothetical protein